MGTSQLTRGLLRNTMVRLMRGSVEATTTRSCSGSRPRKQRKQPLKGCCWSYERASQKYSREPQSRESLTDYFLRPPPLTFLLWQKCAFRLVVKVNVVVFPPCAPLDWKSQVAFWWFEFPAICNVGDKMLVGLLARMPKKQSLTFTQVGNIATKWNIYLYNK